MGIAGDYGRTLQFGLRTHCHTFSRLRDYISSEVSFYQLK
jgi:hypothetical protein